MNNFPSFQVWRPSQPGSMIYNRTGEVQLQSDDQVTTGSNGFLEMNIILTGDDRIEFQSGDVVGYYHPNSSRYQVRNLQTDGYVLYRFDVSPTPTSVGLSEANFVSQLRQPLIQFAVGMYFHSFNDKTLNVFYFIKKNMMNKSRPLCTYVVLETKILW